MENRVIGQPVIRGGHPSPNQGSLDAAAAILQLLNGTTERDLVLFLVSGGGSSLVEQLLRAHRAETWSPVAAQLLEDFPQSRARFTRLLPTEYARVRGALAKAEAEGLDPAAPGVWDQILEVARG